MCPLPDGLSAHAVMTLDSMMACCLSEEAKESKRINAEIDRETTPAGQERCKTGAQAASSG